MNELQANAAALTMSAAQAEPLMFTATKPLRAVLRMYAPDNKSFGTLWLDADGVFQFEGNVGESAKQLFEMLTTLSEQSRKGN